jgi:hypothetical protein
MVSGEWWEDEKKLQITKCKLQTNSKLQITMSKITNSMASMQSCIHAFMPYHSCSHLFPSFLSSQLPSFPLYPLAAGGKSKSIRAMVNELNITKQVEITIRNKLAKDRRDVNVYHHSNRSSHIISYNSSITRTIKSLKENDYLHISVVSGPGHLKNCCILDLPSFVDFKFSLTGEEVILVHSGERLLLRIPPGPPVWQLKMIIPKHFSIVDSLNGDYVTIGDADQWPDSLNGEM